jgi:hypothetical protein
VRRSVMLFVAEMSPTEVKHRVQDLESAGVQRVMLNWARFDDLEGIRALIRTL